MEIFNYIEHTDVLSLTIITEDSHRRLTRYITISVPPVLETHVSWLLIVHVFDV